ncbi:DNA-binding transcriptional regulator, IclR family [Lentibacillus persicus]|uniref:DNA-binding transcriptional regulator, IclR family n=1 Tax=Lentibacillus persicus TaxID=640948 RepID=A0A1I1VYV8_9BACI|nr:IclR family transcriptional regulator [Lentibacillus persicus]SFD88157.1 DNA-binding transcriptional regulator, IclR family [Lentibacillus persicus]
MLKTVSLSLEILKMFTKEKPTWGGRELAAEINENHSKVYRILETLESQNFLIKHKETKTYSLGLAVWELGNTLAESIQMKELIHPILEKVNSVTNESVFLTFLDGDEGLTIDAVEARATVRFSVSIGSRTPLYTGASYRSILAHMPPAFIDRYLKNQFTKYTEKTMIDPEAIREDLKLIRENGYAISEGEYTKDVIAVAIPVFYKDMIIGSLTASGPTYRISNDHIKLFVTELLKAKEELNLIIEKYGFYFDHSNMGRGIDYEFSRYS